MTEPRRPVLSQYLSGAEFSRWYWLKDELTGFARVLGIRATGSKELLARRITAHLDGLPFSEPVRKSPTTSKQLSGILMSTTVIPQGQRCSQLVRVWFNEQVGGSFRFDAPMRAFFADTNGTQTLQEALDHYHSARGQEQTNISEQFEYNRFTRDWYRNHPSSSRGELSAAWRDYRSRPIDERGHA